MRLRYFWTVLPAAGATLVPPSAVPLHGATIDWGLYNAAANVVALGILVILAFVGIVTLVREAVRKRRQRR